MTRPGGYRDYWSAHSRFLVADSRPLDSTSASHLPPGTHVAEVVEVEWNWGWVRLLLEGRAGRRIWTEKIWARPTDRIWRRLPPVTDLQPGQLSSVRTRLLRRRLRVVVVEVGEVEFRVCADASILGVDRGGGTHRYGSIEEADAHLTQLGISRREPRVVSLELRPGDAGDRHST